MGWLKPSKRTPKREWYNIEAYKKAVKLSAEYEGKPVAAPVVDKPQKLAADPNFFADLKESLGLTSKRKSA